MQLYCRAALPEQDHRPEIRILDHADDQLMGTGHPGHFLHREAVDFRVRLEIAYTLQHGIGGPLHILGLFQVQRHAADIGFMSDIVGQDLERDRSPDPCRLFHRARHIGGDDGLDNRHAIGLKHLFGLIFGEPALPGGERVVDDALGPCGIGGDFLRLAVRHLHQCLLVPAIGHQMHEGTHRLLRCVIGGDAVFGEQAARRFHGLMPDPAGQDRLDRFLPGRHHRPCGINAVGNRGRTVDYDQRIHRLVGEDRIEGGGVAAAGGITDNVDRVAVAPGTRHGRIERVHGLRRQAGQMAVEVGGGIGSHDAKPAAIGQDRQLLAFHLDPHAEGFHRIEQLVHIGHAQHPGPAERGIIDIIGPGECAGMARRRLGT